MTSTDEKDIQYRPNTNLVINMVHSNKESRDGCLMYEDEVAALVKLTEGKHVIEIGSFRGGSAKAMLPLCKSLICIDPHDDIYWTNRKEKGEPPDVKGEQLHLDFLAAIAPWKEKVTYLRKYSQDALSFLCPDCCEILFVDGDHSFESCQRDLSLYVPHVHPKYVAVHDYCIGFPGVIAACHVYFQRNPTYLVNTLAVYRME